MHLRGACIHLENDPTNGYEAIAKEFIAYRSTSTIGVETVRSWARSLGPEAVILDLGCGNGIPISKALVEDGHTLYGIDSSPTLISSFRDNFPELSAACEPAESSNYFGRQFDGVVAWGLLFLLPENVQSDVIHRISKILKPGGQFLFTSPKEDCTWMDSMTGLESRSLGREKYEVILSSSGLSLIYNIEDEGDNYYYIAKNQNHGHN